MEKTNRWDLVIPEWYTDLQRAVIKGNADEVMYIAGQVGVDDPISCCCDEDCRISESYRKRFAELPEDHWDKWLHHNHALHNATVWRICNSARPGFIQELAASLRKDMAEKNPFFTPEWAQAMLDGFFTENPTWLGQYRPGAKAA